MPARPRTPQAKERKDRTAAMLATARDEYAADIRRGHGGPTAAARYSDRIDELVRDLTRAAKPSDTAPFAICALGGYGRRMLCLHSDLDLLIVFDGAIGPAEERFVKALLHPLWDLRFTVGSPGPRAPSDFEHLDAGNPEFLLAVLDARLLGGDRRVFDVVSNQLARAREGTLARGAAVAAGAHRRAARRVQRHVLSARARHQERAGRPARHRLGSLDQDALRRRLARVAAIQRAPPVRSRGFCCSASDRSSISESGRNVNILSHPLQERVAEALRFGGAAMRSSASKA